LAIDGEAHKGQAVGLTIGYTIRLGSRACVAEFLAAARREARARAWKLARTPRGTFEALPHGKCEPVRLDFSRSLTTDESVKTSDAPARVHVQIVEFLRALEPLARSMDVIDECEYWDTGDRERLRRHRAGFDAAFGRARGKAKGRSVKLTLGSLVIRPSPEGEEVQRR